MPEPSQIYDVFLSHGSPDKPWVEALARELAGLGLKPFLDAQVIKPAANFPLVLSDALAASRFLVLVLSPNSARDWVRLEWPSFLAHHGPRDRLLPVMLEPTEVPALLSSLHRIRRHRPRRGASSSGDRADPHERVRQDVEKKATENEATA